MRTLTIVAMLLTVMPALAEQPVKEQNQQIAKVAVQFLNRAQLNGQEAETMTQVKAWLVAIGEGRLEVQSPAAGQATAAPRQK